MLIYKIYSLPNSKLPKITTYNYNRALYKHKLILNSSLIELFFVKLNKKLLQTVYKIKYRFLHH